MGDLVRCESVFVCRRCRSSDGVRTGLEWRKNGVRTGSGLRVEKAAKRG